MSDLAALADALDQPVAGDLSGQPPSEHFVRTIPISYARQHGVIGLARQHRNGTGDGNGTADGNGTGDGTAGSAIGVAISSRRGWRQLDILGRRLRRAVEPVVATEEAITAAINAAYSDRSGQVEQVVDSLDADSLLGDLGTASQEDLLDTEGRAPVIRLVNHLLFEAVRAGASDIHVQPYEDRVVVRQRIDGVLFDSFEIPKAVQEEVLTRIKVLGHMNIAEKRLPQDGRATVQLGDRTVDLRIASLPTSHNERIVIRLLDKSARLYTLEELGMPPETLARFGELIRLDHGLILVTGPTGSGKSTTLYGSLQEINTTDLNVLTLEDPIEYQLDGISQTQINERKGMTFASGMRSVLRQDPDIIMVGEIRDHDTATMAIQASLTGHLVFSTLHTNDAASAVTRLLDLGIEPYLVSSSLVAVLAQRLVRSLCPNCKQPLTDEPGDRRCRPVGCDACRQTGYRGRLGLFEFLVMDDALRDRVQRRANAAEIRLLAMESGLELLSVDGLKKVAQGLTTIDEVRRVTSIE